MNESYANGGLTLTMGRIATLTLARPDKRNAMTQEMWAVLPEICAHIAAEASVRVLIVTGAGKKAFCAGADIAEFEQVYGTAASTMAYNARVRAAQAALRDLRCPTIAAIRGACFGGGCGLALACDLRVADNSARFAITPAKLGLAYSPEDTWQLMEKVGVARAKDMLLTGRAVPPDEALSMGLIDRLTEGDGVEAAIELAESLAVLAPAALSAIKTIANGLSRPDAAPGLQQVFESGFAGSEFREGYSAFLEKRRPDFDKDLI